MRDLILDLVKYAPALVLPGLTGIIEILVVTSLFEPGDYGQYSLVLTTIALMVVSTGWMGTTIVRFYPASEMRGEEPIIVATMLRIYVGIAILVSLISAGILGALSRMAIGEITGLHYLCIPVFVLLGLSHTLQQFYRARRQISFFNYLVIWQHVGRLGFGLLLAVVFEMGIAGLVWGYTLALLVGIPLVLLRSKLPLSGLWHRREASSSPNTQDPGALEGPRAVALLRYGLPLALCNAGGWIIMYLDRYMLQAFRGAEAVGVYAASYNISERLMAVLLSLFLLASRPIEMQSWEKGGEARMADALENTTRLYLLATLPLVVLLSVFGRELLRIFAGQAYVEGYAVVPYFVAGAFMLGIHQRYQGPLLIRQKTALILLLFVVAGLFNITLNAWVVPRFSYHGAAVVKFLSYLVLAIATVVVARSQLPFRFPIVTLLRCVPALSALAISSYAVKHLLDWPPLAEVIVAGSVAVVVYAIVLLALGEITSDERRKLKQLFIPRS